MYSGDCFEDHSHNRFNFYKHNFSEKNNLAKFTAITTTTTTTTTTKATTTTASSTKISTTTLQHQL